MGLLPPIIYSGYNANNFNPVLTYIYDSGINGYRAVTPADLGTSVGAINVSGIGQIIVETDDIEEILSGIANGIRITGLVGVSGQKLDSASGYNSGGLNFMNVGGRAVDLSGWNPGYGSGSGALFNFNRENGAVLVQQTDLNKDIDSVTSYPVGGSFVNSSVPSGFNGTAITGSSNLISWGVQNLQTGRLWLKFGDGAHFTSFNVVLAPATYSGAADGGKYFDDSAKWKGNVSVSGEFNTQYSAWGIYA